MAIPAHPFLFSDVAAASVGFVGDVVRLVSPFLHLGDFAPQASVLPLKALGIFICHIEVVLDMLSFFFGFARPLFTSKHVLDHIRDIFHRAGWFDLSGPLVPAALQARGAI